MQNFSHLIDESNECGDNHFFQSVMPINGNSYTYTAKSLQKQCRDNIGFIIVGVFAIIVMLKKYIVSFLAVSPKSQTDSLKMIEQEYDEMDNKNVNKFDNNDSINHNAYIKSEIVNSDFSTNVDELKTDNGRFNQDREMQNTQYTNPPLNNMNEREQQMRNDASNDADVAGNGNGAGVAGNGGISHENSFTNNGTGANNGIITGGGNHYTDNVTQHDYTASINGNYPTNANNYDDLQNNNDDNELIADQHTNNSPQKRLNETINIHNNVINGNVSNDNMFGTNDSLNNDNDTFDDEFGAFNQQSGTNFSFI